MISTKKTANGVKVTNFSRGPLIGILLPLGVMIYTFLNLDSNWHLPEAFKMKSAFETTPTQETFVFFGVMIFMTLMLALFASYHSLEFDLSRQLATFKKRSLFGFKTLTCPLSSVNEFTLDSHSNLETGSRTRYNAIIYLVLDGEEIGFGAGMGSLTAEYLDKYKKMIDGVRDQIGLTQKSSESEGTSSDEVTFKELAIEPPLQEVSPGVYRYSRNFLGILLLLPLLFFFLYEIGRGIPELWKILTSGNSMAAAMAPNLIALMVLFPFLILWIILFGLIGRYHRTIFDTNTEEIHTFGIGLFGWSRRRIMFDEVTEVCLHLKNDEDSRISARFAEVKLKIRNQKDLNVTSNITGRKHRKKCKVLASELKGMFGLE